MISKENDVLPILIPLKQIVFTKKKVLALPLVDLYPVQITLKLKKRRKLPGLLNNMQQLNCSMIHGGVYGRRKGQPEVWWRTESECYSRIGEREEGGIVPIECNFTGSTRKQEMELMTEFSSGKLASWG